MDEPIADEVRGILDGHVVLDRALAAAAATRDRRPAEPLARHAGGHDAEHRAAAARLRALLAAYERHRDLIALGAYARGADPDTDAALERLGAIEAFLRQRPDEEEAPERTRARLEELVR